jgi:hypothetical protein
LAVPQENLSGCFGFFVEADFPERPYGAAPVVFVGSGRYNIVLEAGFLDLQPQIPFLKVAGGIAVFKPNDLVGKMFKLDSEKEA